MYGDPDGPEAFAERGAGGGGARMPLDAPLPRAWAERRVNLVQFTEMERGGHHSSWEVPEAFAADLRDFVVKLHRRARAQNQRPL